MSRLPWNLAPEWQTESAVSGVSNVLDADPTPEENHWAWMQTKLADGWAYGPLKCEKRKLHPCITSYATLPADQRAKDHLFVAISKTLLEFWRNEHEGSPK